MTNNALKSFDNSASIIDVSHLKGISKTNVSNYTSQGKRKATAGEPIRYKEDILKIRDYLRSNPRKQMALRNDMLFTLGISVGIRGNDLLRLQVRDVLDDYGEVVHELSVFESKTHKTNHPTINEEARETIRAYLDSLNEVDDEDYLFTAMGKKEPMGTDNLYKFMQKIQKDCNLKYHIGVRTLRKTFAYWVIKLHPNDTNVMASLQEMLNHDSMNTTLHYSGHAREHLRTMYDDMTRVFEENSTDIPTANSELEKKLDMILSMLINDNDN